MQIFIYVYLICALAASAYDVNFFDMVTGKGAIMKLAEVIPGEIWNIAQAAMLISVFIMTRNRINKISEKFSGLWILLCVICGIELILNLLSQDGEESVLEIAAICSEIVLIIIMAVLGYKLSHAFSGRIRVLGNAFMFVPGICLILLFVVMACLPENFGELNTKTMELGNFIRVEESHSTETITWTVVMIVISALSTIIPFFCCVNVIDLPAEEMSAEEYSESLNTTQKQTASEKIELPDSQSNNLSVNLQDNEIEPLRKKRSFKCFVYVMSALLIGTGTAFLIWKIVKNTDEPNDLNNDSNIVAEAIYEDGSKMVFTIDRHIKYINRVEDLEDNYVNPESNWEIVDDVLVCFTGEGTSYFSIIDGYVYEGEYRSDGKCWVEEWIGDGETGGLDEVGYYPTPEKGTKLRNFKWLKSPESIIKVTDREAIEGSGNPYKLPVRAYNGLVKPLPSHNESTYEADRLVDCNPKTGWAISFNTSELAESPIWGPNIEFIGNPIIDYIILYNGYCKSEALYKCNYRPAWITIYRPLAPDSGEPELSNIVYDGPLEDTMEPQRLNVNPKYDFSRPTERVVIKLPCYTSENYYAGNLYDHLVISEIEFWGHDK